MYDNTYEEYIRSILGYPNYSNNTYNAYNFNRPTQSVNIPSNSQLEACYPEIYKIIYPMIKKACVEISEPITPELIDKMTNEIYSAVESDNQINVRINLTNEISKTESSSSKKASEMGNKENKEEREDRQFKNRSLSDLIKILIIRDLLVRPGRRPNPGRPPRPQVPPMLPIRPGMENRYYDIYEY